MKSWILMLCAVLLSVTLLPFVAAKSVKEEIVPTLSVFYEDNICEMSAEEYALLVLLGEGKTLKNSETLKSLAVSARTIALYFSLYGCKHEDFDACSDGRCCLKLGSIAEADEAFLDSAREAVDSTKGLALTLDDKPVLALFCLCASSGTRQSEDFIYLSPTAEETKCDIHKFTQSFEKEGLLEGVDDKSSCVVYDGSNKCEFLVIGGRKLDADEFMKEMSLASPEFSLFFEDERVVIEVGGVGNGFGLNLCGAERKAEGGMSFEEILEIYYPRLNLNKIY